MRMSPTALPERSTLRRLLRLLRPHRRTVIAAIVSVIVSMVATLALPALIGRIIDEGIRHHRRDLIWPLSLTALGLVAVRGITNFFRRNLSGAMSVRIEADLRARLFAHLQGLPVSFHDRWQSGQLLARATSDLNAIRMFLGFALVFLTLLSSYAIAVAIALLVLDPWLALLALCLTIPFFVTAMRFNRRMEDVWARSREAVGEVTTVIEESAGGIRILKAFGREQHSVRRLSAAAAELRDVNLEGVGYRALYIPALYLFPNLLVGVVFGVGGFRVIGGALTIGALVAFNQYLGYVVYPLRYVGWILSQAQQAVAAGDRVFEILDTQPTIADLPGATALATVEGEIAFDHVSLTYPGSTLPALHDVDLTIAPGETVALVGASGSGKSTLASLVPRFFDPGEGRVLVDGHDVRHVTLSSLRSQIGVVFDEPVLFSATVRENIAFGFPDATVEAVTRAARAAGAHDFVLALPQGYETMVGEHGFSLSGGQRQRLALARALLAEPRILVLDDPLSSVDVRTEAEIEANLRALLAGHTALLIAHRASTVAMADRVVLIEDGRVTATGRHADLLLTNPAYRRVLAAELVLEELAEVETT